MKPENPKPDYEKILDNVIDIFQRYAYEYRATTQPFRLKLLQELQPQYQYRAEDLILRENLMEHVGSLPVIATLLYPYLNEPEVNLGHVLEMLAIHDIGELITGDEIVFTKKESSKISEQQEALKLIHPSLHQAYNEVEARQTKSAMFAKSVDKIAPDFMDLITPADITVKRFKQLVKIEAAEIMPLIRKHKTPYMEWNNFLCDFHKVLMQRLESKLIKYY